METEPNTSAVPASQNSVARAGGGYCRPPPRHSGNPVASRNVHTLSPFFTSLAMKTGSPSTVTREPTITRVSPFAMATFFSFRKAVHFEGIGFGLQREMCAAQATTSATTARAGDLLDRLDAARHGRFSGDVVPRGTLAAALSLRGQRGCHREDKHGDAYAVEPMESMNCRHVLRGSHQSTHTFRKYVPVIPRPTGLPSTSRQTT